MYDLLESEEKLAFSPRSNIKKGYCNFYLKTFFMELWDINSQLLVIKSELRD